MEVAAPDFAAMWKPMDSGLRRLLRDMRGGSVHEGTLTREQWMQMYTDVYNICVNHDQDLPEQLYENCRGVIHGYLDELKQVRRCAHYTARARCRPALPARAAPPRPAVQRAQHRRRLTAASLQEIVPRTGRSWRGSTRRRSSRWWPPRATSKICEYLCEFDGMVRSGLTSELSIMHSLLERTADGLQALGKNF